MKGEETNSELEEGSQWKFLASSNLLLLKKAAPQSSVTERIEHSQVSASCEKNFWDSNLFQLFPYSVLSKMCSYCLGTLVRVLRRWLNYLLNINSE